MRVAVVGGGLGGVAAAVGLHRQGHDVTLYERGAELREAGTGVALMPNGVRALDALGLGDYVHGQPVRATNGGLRDWRGRPLLIADAIQAKRSVGTTYVVSRTELHRALRAPLPAHLVRTATPVQRLEAHATEVVVVSDGQPVTTADAVVVADGIGSSLRRQLFPEHPGLRQVGRMDLRGMVHPPAGLDVSELLASIMIDRRTGSMFGLFPIGERDLYWFTDTALPAALPPAPDARQQILALMSDWHPAVPALIKATPLTAIYVDPIARLAKPLPSFAVGRIALLGDAAHAMTPDLGQGASQAFEDAATLTRHLTDADPADVPERLLRYDAERRPRTSRLIAAASRLSRMTSRTGGVAWLRDTLLRTTPPRLAARLLAAAWHAE
jgi:2-polyprenyl-6-methoxyphenol hydroxylase-like FAD-dependent oxidoreductase